MLAHLRKQNLSANTVDPVSALKLEPLSILVVTSFPDPLSKILTPKVGSFQIVNKSSMLQNFDDIIVCDVSLFVDPPLVSRVSLGGDRHC